MDNHSQCSNFIDYTSDFLNEWFQDSAVINSYLKQISHYIFQIAGNSLEHSEKDGYGICYYTFQRLSTKRGTQLKVIFGDTGMGIKNSLKTTNQDLPDYDTTAIKKAFMEGWSSRKDQSGGLGFIAVRNALGKYGGEVSIRSGDAIMHYNSQNEVTSFNKFQYILPGTQTVFSLNNY